MQTRGLIKSHETPIEYSNLPCIVQELFLGPGRSGCSSRSGSGRRTCQELQCHEVGCALNVVNSMASRGTRINMRQNQGAVRISLCLSVYIYIYAHIPSTSSFLWHMSPNKQGIKYYYTYNLPSNRTPLMEGTCCERPCSHHSHSKSTECFEQPICPVVYKLTYV